MRFSVLAFRSDIRIALQAPVVKIEKVVRKKLTFITLNGVWNPLQEMNMKKNVYIIMKCSDNQCWKPNLDIYFS